MKFLITAYIALSGSFFANGEKAVYTTHECIVAAPPGIKFGTKVTIQLPNKTLKCIVKDRMPYPAGTRRLDILFPNYKEAIKFGSQTAIVTFH